MFSVEEHAQYQAARSQLAREEALTSAEVWLVGASGATERRRLKLGISDGILIEVVEGDLRKGDRVIVSAEATPAKPAGPLGF
jgi:hypothetical protein